MTSWVGGEVVILDRVAGVVHQLNPTASYIWTACDSSPVDEIAAGLAADFAGAPERVRDDVLRSLADFERLGLLVDAEVEDSALNRGIP